METAWKLENLPAYSGGELNPRLFNCGSGMKDDFDGDTGEDSFMHIVTHTSKEEFCAYCGVLKERGFVPVFENENEAGIYFQFRKEKNVYLY